MLVEDVLFYFHNLLDYGFSIEELEVLTPKKLRDKWSDVSYDRSVYIQIPMESYDDEKWEKLNKVALNISALLKRDGTEMMDQGSGYGLGVREYHFNFVRLEDKEFYSPLINLQFEEVI